MKLPITIFASAILLAGITEGAMAACDDPQIMNTTANPTRLFNLLNGGTPNGNTVCVSASGGGWENQEEHTNLTNTVPGVSGLQLLDYKKGSGDPVDPTTQVGTWSVSGMDEATQVTYYYTHGGNSGPFEFTVHSPDVGTITNLTFCGVNVTDQINATLKTGGGGC